jgi:hypothetical protein
MRQILTVCGSLACVIGLSSAQAATPTYHKEVARVLQTHCQDCHRPGQVAPFALLDYEQARKRAGDLAHVTGERQMPPWPASTQFGGPFRDQRVLSEAEITTLRDWAAAGAPEGNPADAPAPREFSTDWALGKPDVVLTMPEPYELSETGDDEFRVFVLPTNFETDRWIRALDFKPGNRKVVHHIIAAVDASKAGRKKDAEDPKPGYVAVGGFGVPTRDFLPIWTPGSRPRFAPDGAGYLLPAGADILVQLHYHKSGKPEKDSTAVGLYLSDEPLKSRVQTGFIFPTIPPLQMVAMQQKFAAAKKEGRRPGIDEMMRDVLVIPAGKSDYVIKGTSKQGVMARPLTRDILVTSVMPHMHWLGKEFTFSAVLPDEKSTRIPLIRIDHWNFNWQGTYAFAEPIRIPKGAWFEIEGRYDNSAENPANPTKPPQTVHWGEQTNDEMFIGVYEFIPAEAAPVKAGEKTQ